MAKRDLRSSIISAVVGSLGAFIVCAILFFVLNKPTPLVDAQPTPTTPVSSVTPADGPSRPVVDVTDVSSIEIKTVYRGYFEPGDKCSRSYDEYFGNGDGFSSPSSPCAISITFDRNGHAKRLVEVSRWDKATSQKKVVERREAVADITPEQFAKLASDIVSNQAFIAWQEGMTITVSNCSITVAHPAGTKTVMSNVDDSTTAFLPMLNAFKRTEKELNWK
jgi:hypothetical protein